jgi:general nucleoside transport system ATP-binding protein
MTPVLTLTGLTKRFGAVIANDAVDLTLHQGEVLALLGENGAGKTTLMNMLFGHYVPDAGTVQVADASATLRTLPPGQPQTALKRGIGMVHQHFTLAENLSALDNILLGAEPLFALSRKRRAARDKIAGIMERTGLIAPLDEPVGSLSVGERQRVEILKALYRDARILVLDEPTAVLTPQEADGLFASIRTMTADGLSVIFISHKMREVLAFSDRIAVLRLGRKVGEMATADADQSSIARLMVGAETEATTRPTATPGAPILTLDRVSVTSASARGRLHDASLTVHAHEIVGIAGVSGNGQGPLARLITGLLTPDSGTVTLNGQPVRQFTPAAMQSAGVGAIPEDRHHDGVVGAMSVAENLIIEDLHTPGIARVGFLRRAEIRDRAASLTRDFDVRGPGPDAEARLLSGGNIQKLILARVLTREPALILANQPTRGLDFGAAAEVGRRLIEARGRGAGVLLISEDLDEILGLADRILVIHDGHLAEATSRDRAAIGLIMAGQSAGQAA